MLPDISNPVWTLVVTGKKPVRSTKATFNLLIQGNKMSFARDPSPTNVRQLVAKTHAFLTQFESIFVSEIAEILK